MDPVTISAELQEPSILQVVLMGIITVFVVLVGLIIIVKIMSAIIAQFTKTKSPVANNAPAAPVAPPVMAAPAANNSQVVAAIATVLAEEMGTSVSHIRIHSIKKI